MAILTIDSVTMPDPSSFSVDYMYLSSEDSGRTQSGSMVIDFIANKVKLKVSYPTIPWSDCSIVMSAIYPTSSSTVFMEVNYPDPKTGTYTTKTFYRGDVSCPAITLVNGKEYWQGLAFDLIEK